MRQAINGLKPDDENRHRPELVDKYGKTVAMYLAEKKIQDIPERWHHRATL